MKIGELSPAELAARVRGPGLQLQTGPFLFQVRTKLALVIDGLRVLYGHFSLGKGDDFSDFEIEITAPAGVRRWLHRQVTVYVDGEEPATPLPFDQAYALFEGCLNWCIYTFAHQYLIIHAAALERDGKALILPAPPGSGKSTLCAALAHRGWRLLTDELTLIDPEHGWIVPLARPISLKNESIRVIQQFEPRAVFGPVSRNTIKGTVAHCRPLDESVARANESCRAAWCVFPSYRRAATTSARSVPRGQAFMRIADSSVNYTLFGDRGFTLLADIMNRLSCYDFEYSDLNEAIAWFERLN